MKTLTVFTPAYNRAYSIGRTYDSLCRQSCQDFIWMVIDDGSVDNTKELVSKWIEEKKIEIIYIYQKNQGMHGAHNTAYRNITTELNVCVDSDDYMPDNAVEIIVSCWQKHGSNRYSGLVGLDVTENGDVIGTEFPEGTTTIKLGEFYQKGGKGDKKLVYRTDVINSVPEYPLFEGEKYVGLAYKYLLVEREYEMLVVNKPLTVVEYQQDGSSINMFKQYWNNPHGWMFYRTFELSQPYSFKRKAIVCIHYISSCIIAKDLKKVFIRPYLALKIFLFPLGFFLYLFIRYKVKHNSQMKF